VEDGVRGWRMCGDDAAAAAGWAAETGRTLRITFHSEHQQRLHGHQRQSAAQPPDIGAWIRFAREYCRLPSHLVDHGGSVAEWLACWTRAQKGAGSNRSRDDVA